MSKASAMLSAIVSDLVKKCLDECIIVSAATKMDILLVLAMIRNARESILGLQRNDLIKDIDLLLCHYAPGDKGRGRGKRSLYSSLCTTIWT